MKLAEEDNCTTVVAETKTSQFIELFFVDLSSFNKVKPPMKALQKGECTAIL
ncbi:MAG: hypothetical protein H7A37_09980 [Chlamydiales bacterium]|nr:hypothetical protein [Chlamydiia bacterium]MCP5508605.1 hypothetical protein [Chlamydiales bacterium]